jgi:hypothetical protein
LPILHRLFLNRVRAAAGFGLSFDIDADRRGWSGYTLYFATGSITGLERMKEAMWAVDPVGGSRFAYSDDSGQLTMFDTGPEFLELERALRNRFGTREFTIEQAQRLTAVSTPFASRLHLKTKTLAVAERAGRLAAMQPGNSKRRPGTYPDGTVLRFTS